MNILKNILLFCFFYIYCTLFSYSQETEKKSRFIEPTIESDAAFEKAIQSQEYVVVDFWAVWCRPCQFFAPEFEKIAKKFYKKASFYKLNVDVCPATSIKYDAKMIPLIVIFKNGKEVKRYVGLTAKERIIFDLEGIMKK